MTVVNGFLIVLMLLLFIYSVYRALKKRSLLMLIPTSLQIFSLILAIMCFINDLDASIFVEAVFVSLGIIPPSVLVISDYRNMTNKIKAKGVFEGFIENIPVNTRCISFPCEGINAISDHKQLSEIMKELKSTPEEMQNNFRKCLGHAYTLMSGGSKDHALHICETLTKVAGSSHMMYYNYACMCFELEKYEEASEAFKKSLEYFNGDTHEQSDIYYNLGNSYYMMKQYEKAARYYEKALEKKPDDPNTLENLSYAYVRTGDAEKGIAVLKKITTGKGRYRPHYVWGRLFYEAGRYTEALGELERAVKLKAGSLEALEALAKVLVKLDKAEEAISTYDKILQLDPDNYLSWYNKANTCASVKRWKDAAMCYEEAVRIRPDHYKCYFNMAMALDESGNSKKAIAAYKKVIRLCPGFTDAYNNLGILLSLEGRREEAMEVYGEGIKRSPDNYSLHFNTGICLFDEGRYVEAAGAFRNAADIDPDELEIYYYLGAALTEMRHYKDAIEAYKSALAIKPTDGELQYNLASVYAMLGRYDIAGENLERAIELDEKLLDDVKVNSAFDGMRGRSDFVRMISK